MTDKLAIAMEAGETLARTLARLHRENGWPLDAILAGALAELVAMLGETHGGEVASETLTQAAQRVRGMPADAAAALMLAQPAGRA